MAAARRGACPPCCGAGARAAAKLGAAASDAALNGLGGSWQCNTAGGTASERRRASARASGRRTALRNRAHQRTRVRSRTVSGLVSPRAAGCVVGVHCWGAARNRDAARQPCAAALPRSGLSGRRAALLRLGAAAPGRGVRKAQRRTCREVFKRAPSGCARSLGAPDAPAVALRRHVLCRSSRGARPSRGRAARSPPMVTQALPLTLPLPAPSRLPLLPRPGWASLRYCRRLRPRRARLKHSLRWAKPREGAAARPETASCSCRSRSATSCWRRLSRRDAFPWRWRCTRCVRLRAPLVCHIR